MVVDFEFLYGHGALLPIYSGLVVCVAVKIFTNVNYHKKLTFSVFRCCFLSPVVLLLGGHGLSVSRFLDICSRSDGCLWNKG